jgi:acylphosphatase
MKTIMVNIYGRVQGVGFRYFVVKTAILHCIHGFVKNEIDGSVSLKANGNEAQLDLFLKEIEVGNGYSHVDCISIEEVEFETLDDFVVVY